MKVSMHAFSEFAKRSAQLCGHPAAFLIAVVIIVLWSISGPIFAFSDTWQLVINTGTTIITFLMVFLIQNTQNRDTGAIQAKLDELIRSIGGAHNVLLDLEEMNEEDIERTRKRYRELAAKARKDVHDGQRDTDSPEVDSSTVDAGDEPER